MVVPSLNTPNGSGLCNKTIHIRSQTRVLLYTVAGEIKSDTDTTDFKAKIAYLEARIQALESSSDLIVRL